MKWTYFDEPSYLNAGYLCKDKNIQKQEALDRMEALEMNSDIRSRFKLTGDICIMNSDTGKVLTPDEKIMDEVRKFEKREDGIVYYGMLNEFSFGVCWSFLFVSPVVEDWNTERKLLTENRLNSYVYNEDVPEYSEKGLILVQRKNGGLIRIR